MFPRNWLLKNRPYSEMEQHRNIIKINLCTVLTPVLCTEAENFSNMLIWPQFHYEFLLEMRDQKFDLFVIFFISLKFYFLSIWNYDVIWKESESFYDYELLYTAIKKIHFQKKFLQNFLFFSYLSKNSEGIWSQNHTFEKF